MTVIDPSIRQWHNMFYRGWPPFYYKKKYASPQYSEYTCQKIGHPKKMGLLRYQMPLLEKNLTRERERERERVSY